MSEEGDEIILTDSRFEGNKWVVDVWRKDGQQMTANQMATGLGMLAIEITNRSTMPIDSVLARIRNQALFPESLPSDFYETKK